MKLNFAPSIVEKLAGKTPPVTPDQVRQCFANREGRFLEDTREDHKTNPPTQWFVAETDYGVCLKVCFIKENDLLTIKSAFVANEDEKRIYRKYGVR